MADSVPGSGKPIVQSLVEQIDWHWQNQARPRLDGLTDDEYFWQPVANCWNVRRRAPHSAEPQPGSGPFTVDFAWPEPVPAPVTTISWRLVHIIVGVLGARIASHFGGEPYDYFSYPYPGTAREAVDELDRLYARWLDGLRAWSLDDLAVQVGDAEPHDFREAPRLDLVLHIHRELIHHLAEIALLRDLYANRPLTG